MIRHCVMFKWNEGTTEDAIAAVAAGLTEMAGLPMMRAFDHGPDAGISDGNWDYTVVADFDDSDGYRSYANDADHLALIANVIKPHISARAAVQYQVS